MTASDRIELQIAHHPSGRYTLEHRLAGEATFHDYVEDGLWAEDNAEVFLEAFYRKLQTLMSEKVSFDLRPFPDTTTVESGS